MIMANYMDCMDYMEGKGLRDNVEENCSGCRFVNALVNRDGNWIDKYLFYLCPLMT